MSIFQTILCPLDFEPNSIAALELATQIAKQNRATLHLVHIFLVPLDTPPGVMTPFDRLKRTAEAKLKKIAAEKLVGKVAHRIHLKIGVPDHDVVRAADEVNADLIVMATHGRRGFKHFLLGSVSEQVVRNANCPVLTVRPSARRTAIKKTVARK